MTDGRDDVGAVVVGVVHGEEEEGGAPWGADVPPPQWTATGAAAERAAEDFLVPTVAALLRRGDRPLAVVLAGADAGVQCRAARACLRAVLAARAVPTVAAHGTETRLPRACAVAYRVVDSASTAAALTAPGRANE